MDFIKKLHEKHIQASADNYPPTSAVSNWTTHVLLTLFPEQSKTKCVTVEALEEAMANMEAELIHLLNLMVDKLPKDAEGLAKDFIAKIPDIYEDLSEDVQAILNGDPAAKSEYEVIRAYPGFYAIAFYRIAHALHQLNIPLIPRMITECAHSKTGIDIHPGAVIAPSFFIDHGTGIVIGETCVIGRGVKIYQGVTLGALSVAKEMAETKRHPTIEENVVIYSGATILGGKTIIGRDSVIGGNVWLTKSIEPNSMVYYTPQIKFKVAEASE